MDNEINQITIFLPLLAIVLITVIGFLKMAVARTSAVKGRTDSGTFYRAFIGEPEPEYAIVAVRHYGNLFETPVLFYAGCLTAFVVGAVTPWSLAWAWGYVVARAAQSLVHLTHNNPGHRGLFFVISWLFLIALWVTLAMAIFAMM